VNILYRRGTKNDIKGISEILFRTGFMGEDLAPTGRFRDKKLFALVNTDGYVRFETENGFVAQDRDTGNILGYIIGTDNTIRYEKKFALRMYWRFVLRLFLVTWWRYPESFKTIFYWFFTYETKSIEHLYNGYPAHLHINILPGYQRMGIGKKLIDMFLLNMVSKGVVGVHLGTSNYNFKALPFYKKNGFSVIFEKANLFWPGVDGQVSIIFGRKLETE
jgi:ribosomal protein S18 acetylase RimI-like enzyme